MYVLRTVHHILLWRFATDELRSCGGGVTVTLLHLATVMALWIVWLYSGIFRRRSDEGAVDYAGSIPGKENNGSVGGMEVSGSLFSRGGDGLFDGRVRYDAYGQHHHLTSPRVAGAGAAASGAEGVQMIVWQSLELPPYRHEQVQRVLEHWHLEAAMRFIDSVRVLQDALCHYTTALDWAGKLFLPERDETNRLFRSGIIYAFLDIGVCSKRLLYLSVVGVTVGSGEDRDDIDLRKTKAVHALGLYYVVHGRVLQLLKYVRESASNFLRETVSRHGATPSVIDVVAQFSRLAQYVQDALEFLLEYFREVKVAIMGATVHPNMTARSYRHLHTSLQSAGQFFSICLHIRKMGSDFEKHLRELRAAVATSNQQRTPDGKHGEGNSSYNFVPTATAVSTKKPDLQ